MFKKSIRIILILFSIIIISSAFLPHVVNASSYQACGKAYDANIPDPTGIHGLWVLFPPYANPYLLNNSEVCGANFYAAWDTIETANGTYNFTSLNDQIKPWVAAGKGFNLIIIATSDGNQQDTPQWVFNEEANSPLVCKGNIPLPYYWEAPFYTQYQEFVSNVVNEYKNNASLGYARVGLGRGGESSPFINFADCLPDAEANGYSNATMIDYVSNMLNFEGKLEAQTGVQLGVGINYFTIFSNPPDQYPASTAANAVLNKIEFGSQGLSPYDPGDYANGEECSANWCNLFNKYHGEVPFELQDSMGDGPYFSSVIPFAVGLGSQNMEIYYDRWTAAFDPTNVNYSQYHEAYANTIYNAALVLGFSSPPNYNATANYSTSTITIPNGKPLKIGKKAIIAIVIIVILLILIILIAALVTKKKPKRK